jgi:cellulose biosynthesis protein BcsQ
MRKIAILNFKGRTGKTTTAVNLGHALSLKDDKVLIISIINAS